VVGTVAGPVPRVRTQLDGWDEWGAFKVRCNIGRMTYRITPGLYAIGNPDQEATVLVTANYKLTFDRLRQELAGQNLWLLVLDTAGINVWCAAGKGTFGTAELLQRLQAVRLSEIVGHRTLVLPQLGAPGVAAHDIRRDSGFRVIYGPVQAKDIPAFLAAGLQATPEMRRVRFPLSERLAVAPVELVIWFKYGAAMVAILGGAAAASGRGWGPLAGILLLGLATYLAGTLAMPLLLPWLPGRAFAIKGAVLGAALAGACQAGGAFAQGPWEAAGWWLMMVAGVSFLGMNYTGASTFTSQSGVQHELRFAFPVQMAGLAAGILLFIAAAFIRS
jgi:acetyl-CoA decarbonylase/synthase complex subunit gamma